MENRVHTLEGTGLGLSIVRNIIYEKHRSKIGIISEVGVGTTFWFDLTMYQESPIASPIQPMGLPIDVGAEAIVSGSKLVCVREV